MSAAIDRERPGTGYPEPSSPSVSATMRGNRKRDTGPEMRLRSALHRQGLRFRVQRQVAVGGITVRPDVVFGPAKTAVFVDGCFWHGCPDHGTSPRSNNWYWTAKLQRNRWRDKLVDEALHLAGWSVVRIWEHEGPCEAVVKIVAAVGRGM